MKKTSVLAGLLALSLSVLLFAGCGGNSTSQKASPGKEAPQNSTAAAETNTDGADGEVTLEKAKEIALTDAGVKESDAVFKKAELDTENSRQHYDVEFYAGDKEYEYEIDRSDGSILSANQSVMDGEDYDEREALVNQASGSQSAGDQSAGNQASGDPASEKQTAGDQASENQSSGNSSSGDQAAGNQSSENQAPEENRTVEKQTAADGAAQNASGITEKKAFEIALENSGVAASDVSGKEVRLEKDDDTGLVSYEVEFRVGRMEYSYKIDPDTGEILSSEAETDD